MRRHVHEFRRRGRERCRRAERIRRAWAEVADRFAERMLTPPEPRYFWSALMNDAATMASGHRLADLSYQ